MSEGGEIESGTMDTHLEDHIVGHGCLSVNALHRCSRLVIDTLENGVPSGGDVLVGGGETCSRVLPQAARLVASHKAKQRALCFLPLYNPSSPIHNLGRPY
jgi:hypothetical protein